MRYSLEGLTLAMTDEKRVAVLLRTSRQSKIIQFNRIYFVLLPLQLAGRSSQTNGIKNYVFIHH